MSLKVLALQLVKVAGLYALLVQIHPLTILKNLIYYFLILTLTLIWILNENNFCCALILTLILNALTLTWILNVNVNDQETMRMTILDSVYNLANWLWMTYRL